MTTVLAVSRDEARAHPAFRAWQVAQPHAPTPTAVEALKPRRVVTPADAQRRVERQKWSVFRLHGAMPGDRSVIAKFCSRRTAELEQLIYEELLPRAGVLAPALLGAVAADESAWLFLSDEGDEEWCADDRAQQGLFTRAIATLHSSAAGNAALTQLPRRDSLHYRTVLHRSCVRLANAPALEIFGRAQLERLRTAVLELERVERRWPAVDRLVRDVPDTLVHGDLVPKNVRVRRNEREASLVLLDWEMAGAGPPVADLAQDWLVASPDLRSRYRERVHDWLPHLTDDDVLRMIRVGTAFRLIASISWQLESLELPAEADKSVANVSAYTEQLVDVVADLPAPGRAPHVSDDVPNTLRLEAALADAVGDARLRVVAREPNTFTSTFPSEVVTCGLGDGSTIPVLCKFGPSEHAWADLHFLGRHRRGVTHEARVYREVLEPLAVSTPRFYGAADAGDWTWMFVEYVAGATRVNRSIGATALAAAWLGDFHARSSQLPAADGRSWLRRFDADDYRDGAEAAESLVSSASGDTSAIRVARRNWDALARLLESAPQVITHGEFYPSNVLRRRGRIVPVDWETAAVGPGALDVAALTEGWDEPEVDRALAAYAAARWPDDAVPARWRDEVHAARIFLQLRFLGDPGDWSDGRVARRLDALACACTALGLT